MQQYAAFRMQVRDPRHGIVLPLHDARKLWQAYLVTLYGRIEQDRINFQANNQDMFRLETTARLFLFIKENLKKINQISHNLHESTKQQRMKKWQRQTKLAGAQFWAKVSLAQAAISLMPT